MVPTRHILSLPFWCMSRTNKRQNLMDTFKKYINDVTGPAVE